MLLRVRSYFKIVIINIAVFLIILLTIETGIRLKSLIFNNVPFFGNRSFVSPWFTAPTKLYPIEQDGRMYFRHRNEPTALKKEQDQYRIIAVGGSTTENNPAYSVAKIDYASVLENLLNQNVAEQKFEVLNAGTSAYSTAHSLVNISLRILEFSPDSIILMHNLNDSSVNNFKPGVKSDYSNKYMKPYYLNSDLQMTLSFRGFLFQFRLLKHLGLTKLLADRSDDISAELATDYTKGLEIFKRNLEVINSICNTQGIKLILLSQPRITGKAQTYIDVQDEVFHAYNKAIAEVSTTNHIQFIDMYEKMGQDDTYFTDGLHYTPKGIYHFSQILFEELGPLFDSSVYR